MLDQMLMMEPIGINKIIGSLQDSRVVLLVFCVCILIRSSPDITAPTQNTRMTTKLVTNSVTCYKVVNMILESFL